jgi:hypothetical protein
MELEIAPDLPLYARGDQQRIRQVLLNLLYNAVKFTVRGSVTLSVGVKETTPTHYCLTTSVSDTGIGMDEPSQKKLFGMFIKIKDARVRNPLGVGLGLAICKQLVELMGGSIWVESEYGTGSSFSFTLKVERADAESDIQMVEEEMLAQHSLDVGEADMQPATILVAEDNEFNMEVVKTMLQGMGHTVDIVWDGGATSVSGRVPYGHCLGAPHGSAQPSAATASAIISSGRDGSVASAAASSVQPSAASSTGACRSRASITAMSTSSRCTRAPRCRLYYAAALRLCDRVFTCNRVCRCGDSCAGSTR